jgi:predicted AlkP superfamily pyrophosphatase or phosphodiesterase
MRKIILLLCLGFTFFQSRSQEKKYVIIISIDGFRPDFYREDKWATPILHHLAKNGVSADGVRGVFPSVTYPSHTTIITGKMPLEHGIYYNSPFEPDGATGKWYWESDLIKTPTLWSLAKNAGLKTASVFWPVSVGAPVDYNIPEFWSLDKSIDRISPIRENAKPKGLFEEIEQNATGKLTAIDLNSDFLSADENGSRMVAYLIKKYHPNLLTFHIYSVDHASHAEGRDGEMVRRAVAGADHAVGNILEAIEQAGIKENTTLIITGDHGFVNIYKSLNPNVLLAQNGVIADTAAKANWKAKFHTSGAAAFLHLNQTNDVKTVNKVRSLLKALPEEQKSLFRIVERKELDEIGTDPNVALALAPIEGYSMGVSTKGDFIKSAKGGTHGFFPDFKNIETGFIAYGAIFKKEVVIPSMGLEDIAPIVSKILNLKMITVKPSLEKQIFLTIGD